MDQCELAVRGPSSCDSGEVAYLGGRDVENSNCRSDSSLRLHLVRNSPLASLVARGKRGVVRGQRFSEDWSSPHCNERCGREPQSTSARAPARVLRKLRIRIRDIPAVIRIWVRVQPLWIRCIPAVIRLWIRVHPLSELPATLLRICQQAVVAILIARSA